MKLTLLASLSLAALAQEMTGPTLGWSTGGRAVQAIYGVAGAARMGPANAWPEDLSGFVISPGGQRAAALAGDLPVLVDLVTHQRQSLGATPADLLVWSPLGTALLTADRRTGQVRIYAQRGAAFVALPELTFPGATYAVSDDGSSSLAVSGDELLLHTPEGTRVAGSKSAAFTFLAKTNTPIIADGEDLLIGANRYAAPPGSLLADSPAADRILLVDRAGGKLFWFDSQGAALAEASCQCAVDHLERLGASGMLRLVTSGEGPAWLTETSVASQRLFFVPASYPSEVQQ